MALANMQSTVDLLSPTVRQLQNRAGASVRAVEVLCDKDYVHDEVYVRLVVTHELLRWPPHGNMFDRPNLHLIYERMRKAMLVRDTEAKAIALGRRRMFWRAAEAKKSKPRRQAERGVK